MSPQSSPASPATVPATRRPGPETEDDAADATNDGAALDSAAGDGAASPAASAPPTVEGAPRSRARETRPDGRRGRRRRLVLLVGLAVLAVAASVGVLTWDNPMTVGSEGFWLIAQMRVETLVSVAVVAVAQGAATVAFQTATHNRILTPSIMGFESLYTAVQTGAVFLFGIAGATMVVGLPQFLLQAVLMVAFASALYGWLLSGRFSNMHLMLLVGVVIGGGLGSLSTFMQRLLTPSEFDVLTARMFGSIANAESAYLPYALPAVLVVAAVLWLRGRRLDVVALGADAATSLGLNHRREVMLILLMVSVLMAMSTSLVGPMTFLGFLAATLTYQLFDTPSHRLLLPAAGLVAYTILTVAYFLLRHVFYAQGAVTIIVELIGGGVFLIVLMRKGRL